MDSNPIGKSAMTFLWDFKFHSVSIIIFQGTVCEKLASERMHYFKKHSHDKLSSGFAQVLKYLSFLCKMLTIY